MSWYVFDEGSMGLDLAFGPGHWVQYFGFGLFPCPPPDWDEFLGLVIRILFRLVAVDCSFTSGWVLPFGLWWLIIITITFTSIILSTKMIAPS